MPERSKVMIDPDLYKTIIEGMHEGVYFVDPERRITFWNRGAERITGFTADDVMNRGCHDNIMVHIDAEGNQLCTERCPLVAVMQEHSGHAVDHLFLHHKDGQRIPVTVSISAIRDEQGRPVGAVELFRETVRPTLDAEQLSELKKAALIDLLTALPNRRYLTMHLEGNLQEYCRHGLEFGLIFIDVDHFKLINDDYGHDVGDIVLQRIAATLQANMRSYDMVGRWGGEEFMAVIRYVSAEQSRAIAQKLCHLVENTYVMQKSERIGTTITLGVTQVRQGDTVEELVRRADQLMYEGKRQGRNRVVFG